MEPGRRTIWGVLAACLMLAVLIGGAAVASASSWSFESVPDPTVPSGQLSAVSCPLVRVCMALGSGPLGAIPERWNGRSWAIESIPDAAVAHIAAVSCASSTACAAVGWSGPRKTSTALAERWNGTRWSLEPMARGSVVGDALRGVSCPTRRFCVAVGSRRNQPRSQILAEVWNGSSWSIQHTSTRGVPVRRRDYLIDVSCASARSCVAVGGGIVERWNGNSWSLQRPNVKPAAGLFTAVSCSSAKACVAVGAGRHPFWASRNGQRWTVRRLPDFSARLGGDEHSARFPSVACTSATACIAVGSYFFTSDGGGGQLPLAVRLDGHRWSLVYGRFKGVAPESALSGVSCAARRSCETVGASNLGAGIPHTLGLHWNGRSWSTQTTANQTQPSPAGLSGVSCSSADACTAVGSYVGGNGQDQPLADTWNGDIWSIQKTPKPPSGRIKVADSGLNAVSCTSVDACMAVGSGVRGPLAERWDGSRWTILKTPIPAQPFTGVSCTSADACTAVGSYVSKRGGTLALAERWNGTNWTVQTLPDPAGTASGAANELFSVSCSSATACMAVGAYQAPGPDGAAGTLAEGWNGTSWTPQATPQVNDPTVDSPILRGVSCPSTDSCIAVGSTQVTQLAEQWNGAKWSIQSLMIAPGGEQGVTAVSCTSPAACAAVGSIESSSVQAAIWDGTDWTPQNLPLGPGMGVSQLSGVSCISDTVCTAVGATQGVPMALRSL